MRRGALTDSGRGGSEILRPFLLFALVLAVILSFPFRSAGTEEGSRAMVIESLERSGMPGALSVLVISTLPIFELRGGIPVAINYFKMRWWIAYCLCVVGNMVPVVPLLLFLGGVSRALRRFALFERFFTWLFERTRRRGGIIERYRSLGLMLFVAIPLPVTGAWTGSVAAFLFGMRVAPSVLFILFGVLIAGVIVTVLSVLGILGAILAGVGLLSVAGWSVISARRKVTD